MATLDTLHGETASLRCHAFNCLLMLAMKMSSLSFFVITPWIPQMAASLCTSVQVMTSANAIYQIGQFVGCVTFGWLAVGRNTLKVTWRAMLAFVSVGPLLTLYLASGVRTHSRLDFAVFATAYFALSALSTAALFGLEILKKTNSTARCRRYIMVQGVLLNMVMGAAIPISYAVGHAVGWTMLFLVLSLFVLTVVLCMYATATEAHVAACEPPSGKH